MFTSFEITIFFSFPVKMVFFLFFLMVFYGYRKNINLFYVLRGIFFQKISFNYQFLLSIVLIILLINFFTLLPFGFSFTSTPVILVLAFCSWVSLYIYLFFKNINKNISYFLPVGTPVVLIFFLI